MKLICVKNEEADQRLDKLLARYLKEAPKSFLYKMLRKKNITLNGKKADGSEKVKAGDEIRIFLSDETYEKFAGKSAVSNRKYPTAKLQILYEDEHILLVNKPAGMLTQKAKPSDVSLNEYLLGYLQQTGAWRDGEIAGIRPSVCNRLDRNTSGIVVCGKSLAGLQQMAALLRDRSMHKYYQCLVSGQLGQEQRIEGYLWKDEASNKVQILREEREGALPIVTEYRPLKVFGDCTLLEVCLITGRSHQIRAHLASTGHPIIGDSKYGDRQTNDRYRKMYGLQSQLLHACRLELPQMAEPLQDLSGKIFTAEPPLLMREIIKSAEKET
ncbi:MAG: RluA family pseudouridine synthase [Clostridiales bacterium]|nr:RluA family pseudouridine synthase [Clostridiales bacterium]